MEQRPPHPAARVAVVAAALAVFIGLGFVVTKIASRLLHRGAQIAERLSADLEGTLDFRPQITVNGATVVAESRSIEEVALVQKAFDHTYDWRQTYMGSTKEIEVKGYFIGKAGYDLTQPFSVDVSGDGQTIRATTPPPKILSVEQMRFEVLKDDDGWWNKISAQDRQDAMNALLEGARASLAGTGVLRETNRALSELLQKQFRKESPKAFVQIENAPH